VIVLVLVAVCSYLIGAIPFSYIFGRILKGIDLRQHGSGNLGASNCYRILGPWVALTVLLLDIAKGFFPVFLAARIDFGAAASGVEGHWFALAAMFASILGHLFCPYLKFTGGKGIATSAGAFLALSPWAFLGAFVVFLLVFAARRIVSLASISAAVTLPLFVYLADRFDLAEAHWTYLVVSIAIMAVVVVKHRSNIQRLVAGTEPALTRK
jgi:glycerol-3-phosphate acyltransferase PlsY